MIDFFKTYMEELIFMAVFIVIIELILPKGNMKKYVYSISGVIIILLIISPIFNTNSEISITNAIDNVIQTISNANKIELAENDIDNFNNFKNEIMTETVKEKIEIDIKEKLLIIGLEVDSIDIEVNDKYQFDKITIYIKSLGENKNNSISKASEAISIVANTYKIENSKITITELGGV